jgi:hypothetical protein
MNGLKFFAMLAATNIVGVAWCDATLASDVRHLDTRFDKLEAAMPAVTEQTGPATPRPISPDGGAWTRP